MYKLDIMFDHVCHTIFIISYRILLILKIDLNDRPLLLKWLISIMTYVRIV